MTMKAKAQASEPSYELHTLGWKAFQDLSATILTEVMGQTIEQFLPTNDGGRDGAFFGKWSNLCAGGVNGSFTVQCKHTVKPNNPLALSEIADEMIKARRLASNGFCDNYLLLTNHGVSGTSEESIRKGFLSIPGIKWFGLFGSTWIEARIRESPRLRMLVPRVYGLGDLSQILDERAYDQARIIFEAISSDLSKFVTTEVHNKAANAILKHGFVILLGEPASGKSMIAATLALGAIDVWNCQAMKLTEPKDIQTHWNPNEPRQFFWFDDAFGATQYQRDMVLSWNRLFPHMTSAIQAGVRIVFTSRDYIFKAALNDIKTSGFPLLRESQVIINVREFLRSEKQQIVYNHMKLGDQPTIFKTQIKPFLDCVSSSAHFLPEIARRLGTKLFTKKISFTSKHVSDFVERPLEYLIEVLSCLDTDSKAAIGLLFMNGGQILHPIALSDKEINALKLLGSNEQRIRKILSTLDDDILRLVRSKPSRWTYKHPTIGDAYARLLASDPELIDIYLRGVRPDKLIKEITCGETGLEGTVIIPYSRYERIITILDTLTDHDALLMFLAYRCDRAFLELYISKNLNFIESLLHFGSFMGSVRKVSLICRLRELHLLPEPASQAFFEQIRRLAVDTPDSDWLGYKHIREVLNDNEVASILDQVKKKLLPDIDNIIQDWISNYDSSDEPDSYFEPLKDALQTYHDQFEEDEEAQDVLGSALWDIDSEIDDLISHRENPYEEDDPYYSSSSSSLDEKERSIFDDVDK